MRHQVNVILKTDSRRRYNTETAILLATDENPKDQNPGKHGRNRHLYMTKKGLFFLVVSTTMPGEETKVEPLDQESAKSIYENLQIKLVRFKDAFNQSHDELLGRPPIFSKTMKQASIWLPEEMITWLSKQPNSMSQTLRDMIQDSMDKNP